MPARTALSPQPELWPEFLKAIRHEVIPALGCTEPIALALASAIAARHLGGVPEKILARVSANLMKNGMGVTVPGTGMVGLPIAAAVGALIGDPDGGLEVLRHLTPEAVQAGQQMLADNRVEIGIADWFSSKVLICARIPRSGCVNRTNKASAARPARIRIATMRTIALSCCWRACSSRSWVYDSAA